MLAKAQESFVLLQRPTHVRRDLSVNIELLIVCGCCAGGVRRVVVCFCCGYARLRGNVQFNCIFSKFYKAAVDDEHHCLHEQKARRELAPKDLGLDLLLFQPRRCHREGWESCSCHWRRTPHDCSGGASDTRSKMRESKRLRRFRASGLGRSKYHCPIARACDLRFTHRVLDSLRTTPAPLLRQIESFQLGDTSSSESARDASPDSLHLPRQYDESQSESGTVSGSLCLCTQTQLLAWRFECSALSIPGLTIRLDRVLQACSFLS